MATKSPTDAIALKKIMIEKGFKTIGSLSEAAGINRNTLGKVLDGKTQPSAEVMNKLVEALNIPPETAGIIFFNKDLRSA
jgi:transcriptional regulator with XRE-family HTH domain